MNKRVVKLPTGKYVKEYDYSQGELSYTETENLLFAFDFSTDIQSFATFFINEGQLEEFEVKIIQHQIPPMWGIWAWTYPPEENPDEYYRATFFSTIGVDGEKALETVKKQAGEYFRLCRIEKLC
jgi:hypothetical protein